MARITQRGCFDIVFFGDAAETPENFGDGYRWPKHDMMPTIARAAPI